MCLVSIIHIHYFFAYFDLHISHNHNYSYSSMFLYMHKYSLFISYFMGSMVVFVIYYKQNSSETAIFYGKFDKDVIYNFEDNRTHTIFMYRDSPARIMNSLKVIFLKDKHFCNLNSTPYLCSSASLTCTKKRVYFFYCKMIWYLKRTYITQIGTCKK